MCIRDSPCADLSGTDKWIVSGKANAQVSMKGFTYKDGLYTVELPAATSDQWQSQMAFETDLTASLSDTYNFYCVLNSKMCIRDRF